MLYQFRIDKNHQGELVRRLRGDGVLCQGWGGGVNGGLSLEHEGFVPKLKAYYELGTTRIPSNLTRIRDFKDGDLLIVPHLPRHGLVSIHEVDGDFPRCYDYRESDEAHLNHRVRVRRSFGLDGRISAANAQLVRWRAKLQWRRLPILPVPEYEADVLHLVDTMSADPDAAFPASDLDEFFEGLNRDVLKLVRSRLGEVNPSGGMISFESICERLLTEAGFEVAGQNEYDRDGGDVDRRCVRNRADVTPFEAGETLLFVQIKKHAGTTDSHAVDQLLRMIEHEPADGCVMSLADRFSEEAIVKAEKAAIALLDGDSIAQLVMGYLATLGGADAAWS